MKTPYADAVLPAMRKRRRKWLARRTPTERAEAERRTKLALAEFDRGLQIPPPEPMPEYDDLP